MISAMKMKKGDTVLVLKGKDKGKQGKIVRVFPKERKIIVEGVNQRIRNVRPRRQGEKGQRVTIQHPMWAANAMIVCSSCGKGTRVAFEMKAGTKIRVCKKCKSAL